MEPEPAHGVSNRPPDSPGRDPAAVRPTLFRFVVQLLAAVDWRWAFLPPLLLVCELGLTYFWLLSHAWERKVLFETLSLVVLWSAVGIAFWRAARTRTSFFLWLSLVLLALLFREYHLLKASTSIVYGVLALLWIVAWRAYPSFSAYLRNPRFMTALMLMGFSYVITQTLDIDTFKKGHPVFGVTEELMELSGHGFALLAALVAAAVPQTKDE